MNARSLGLAILAALVVNVGTVEAAQPPLSSTQLRVELILAKGRVAQAQAATKAQRARADRARKLLTKANARADAQAKADAAALAAMTADRDAKASALAVANGASGPAQTQLAQSLTTITSLQGTVATLQGSLGAAASSQVQALSLPGLWSVLGAISARFTALGDSNYTTSVFTGSSLSDYDFTWYHF